MRLFLILLMLAQPAFAEIRVATWNSGLSRKGPGLLLRDIQKGEAEVEAARATIAALDADVLLLTNVDYDLDLVALRALDLGYPHLFARRPNTGMQTGRDMDGDGRIGGPRDAQGYGWFSGQGGMAVLSRFPIGEGRDFSAFLWRDLPGTLMSGDDLQRLSTTGHWEVPIHAPGGTLTLLAFHATPPVFEPRNAPRNHDETAFWTALIDGRLPFAPPEGPFVILGDANADPDRGDGIPDAIRALLAHPKVQDLHSEPTARFDVGTLRVDYVLPSSDLDVAAAGMGEGGGTHRPVWIDLR